MKLLFLLGFILFFLCLSSVLAYDITSCTNISSSGYYQFIDNITVNSGCNYGYGCILINASSVTLDLRGYSLINNISCSYGIVILPKNYGDASDTHSGINILNGRIIDFVSTGIEFVGSTESSSITFIDFLATMGGSDGIALNSGYDYNLIIGSNLFSNINNAVFGTCLTACKIYDNEIKFATNGLYLWGNGFDVQRNLMGYSTLNSTGCFKQDYPIESGIFCNNCNNSIIKNNDIMSDYALTLTNYANHNNITSNTFRTFYSYNPQISFDTTTLTNNFCNNNLIRGYPTSVFIDGVWECYWGTQTSNAKNIVTDLGTNTVTELCTGSCIASFYCIGNNRVYINSTCGISQNYTCEYGCESGIYGSYCIGDTITGTSITTTSIPIPTAITNISWNTPIVNGTDLSEAGISWLNPFVTPFFLVLSTTIVFCAFLTGVTKSPIVFPLSLLGFTMIYWYYLIIPNILAIFLVILEALGTATLLKNQVSK